MVKKYSNKYGFSKCFRKLFSHHYSALIQLGLSKPLTALFPAALFAEIHLSMDAGAYTTGIVLEVQGSVRFFPPLGIGKAVGMQGATERTQKPVGESKHESGCHLWSTRKRPSP